MAEERINPSYYANQAGLECIDVIERFGLPFCRSNALKYLWRHRQKNGREDLVKALWYLDREISGPQKLPAALRPVDSLYRGLAWLRRLLCAVAVDRDMLAAACGVTGREKTALLAICCGDAKVAKFQVERIIAEQYAPAEGPPAGGDPATRAAITAMQLDSAVAALANLPRNVSAGAGETEVDRDADTETNIPPIRLYAPPVECPEPPAGD